MISPWNSEPFSFRCTDKNLHLHLGVLAVAAVRGVARDAPAGIQGRHSGGTCLANGRQGLHSRDDRFTLLE